jgi:hypothetical protein
MQFRRKPIVIEAEQFHLGQQLSAWMAKATCHGSETCAEHRRRHVAPELPVPVDWTPASVAELIRRHSLNLQQVTALLQAEQEV